jgi:hypothetical protein
MFVMIDEEDDYVGTDNIATIYEEGGLARFELTTGDLVDKESYTDIAYREDGLRLPSISKRTSRAPWSGVAE